MAQSPFTLSKKPMKVFSWNAVELPPMTFGLIPEILNAVDAIAGLRKMFRVIDSAMLELRDIKHVVTHKTVCINHAIRSNLIPNNR